MRTLRLAGLLVSITGCSLVLKLDIEFEGGGGAGGSEKGGDTQGGGGDTQGGGGQGGVAGGGGNGGAPPAVCLDDEFDTNKGTCWAELTNAGVEVHPSDPEGELVLSVVSGNPTWADGEQSYLLYDIVSGPFAVLTRVRTTDNADSGPPSSGTYKMAGLVVQDTNDDRVWQKLEVGLITESRGVLSGFTAAGTTILDPSGEEAQQGPDAILGYCRSGDTQTLMYGPWGGTALQLHVQNDLAQQFAASVRVGIFVGAFTGTPDVSGRFDYVRLRNEPGLSVATTEECRAVLEQMAEQPLTGDCACQ